MANKQGISTAKGFQEKVPFAEQADKVNNVEIKQDENGVVTSNGNVMANMQHTAINTIVYSGQTAVNNTGKYDYMSLGKLPAGTYEILLFEQDHLGYVFEKFYIPQGATAGTKILQKSIYDGVLYDTSFIRFTIILNDNLEAIITNEHSNSHFTVISLTKIVDGREHLSVMEVSNE